MLLLGVLLLADRYVSRRQLLLTGNLEQARLAAAYVEGWVEGHERTLNTLAQSNEVQLGSRADQQALVKRQIAAQPEWQTLYITNAGGDIVVSSAFRRYSILDREYFLRARRTLQPVVSTIITSRTTGDYVIAVAYPILARGQFRGIVTATIRTDEVQRVFTRVSTSGDSFISLWGKDRRLITRSDVYQRYQGKRYSGAYVRTILSGKSGTFIGMNPITNTEVLAGYAPVPGAPWVAVSGSPTAVGLAPALRSLLLFVSLALLVLGVSLWWTYYSANVVGRQVSLLAERAQAIGAGNFATRVYLDTDDELADLARSLNKMGADLALTERIKSDFLSMVSHELKTPLTTILAFLDVLSAGILRADDPRYAEYLRSAQRQSHRLQDMLENLLSVARLEVGGLTVTPRPTALHPIIASSLALYQEAAGSRGLTLEAEVPDALIVQADASKIALVLNNLLDNAIKFTREGRITIRAVVDGECVRVTVTDTGIGLTPEVRDRLFERFYQAEPLLTRQAGGAGLGLVVARALVEAHNGRMFVESAGPGTGSTFGFTLPLAHAAA